MYWRAAAIRSMIAPGSGANSKTTRLPAASMRSTKTVLDELAGSGFDPGEHFTPSLFQRILFQGRPMNRPVGRESRHAEPRAQSDAIGFGGVLRQKQQSCNVR